MHLRLGKQHGTMRKTKHQGIGRVAANFLINLIAYNLSAFPNLSQRNQPAVHATKIAPNQSFVSDSDPEEKENPGFPGFSADC